MNTHSEKYIMEQKICIVGLGYVGLPTAAVLAQNGYLVHGFDINLTIINTLRSGNIHIFEPELNEIVKDALNKGALTVDTKPIESDIFIIAVPTPLKDDLVPNTDHVLAAVHAIAPHVRPGNLVILESTSPVGTTEKVAQQLTECGVDLATIDIAYCPERILPGNILKELIANDRIMGGLTAAASNHAREFYASFVTGALAVTDARTAEMTKLAENAYRNVNIAFANELSMICDEAGINVWDVIACANRHPRVNILKPGPGVGGHCVAVDPLFISHQAKDAAKLISAAHHRNNEKTKWVVEKVRRAAYDFTKEFHRPPTIAVFGLTYKPNSDDTRESPALKIVQDLIHEQYHILAVDPYVENKTSAPAVCITDALERADIAVFLVAHDQFFTLAFPDTTRVFDFCGITNHAP